MLIVKELIKTKKISESMTRSFKEECRGIILEIVKQIMTKSPIVNIIIFLNPRIICQDREHIVEKLKAVLQIMVDLNKNQPYICDVCQ